MMGLRLLAELSRTTMKTEDQNWEEDFIQSFGYFSHRINENAHEKGFYEDGFNFAEKIALTHSELSEALEKHRNTIAKGLLDQPDEHCPEFGGVEIELADTIIRIMDLAEEMNMNLGGAILAKMKFNSTRPYKHGKAY